MLEPDWKTEERVPIRQMLTLADLFSLGNALLGFLSIYAASQDRVGVAYTFILLAIILDGLDGAAARMGYGGGRLGGKLDSFADLVSFVIAPAMLFFTTFKGQRALPDFPFAPDGFTTAALVFAVSAAYFLTGLLRLARFDYLKGGDRHDYFLGVTTPGGAVVLTSIAFVGWDVRPALLVVALTSLLMTSRVRLPKLRTTLAPTAVVVLLLAVLLGARLNYLGSTLLLVAFLTYLVLGPGYVRRHLDEDEVAPSY